MLWLKRGLRELNYKISYALFTDSTDANDIINNSKINKRTKHINVVYYNTRENLLSKEFFLFRIASNNNPTNLLTKPLRKTLHNYYIRLLTNGSEKEC